jgi:hypothetical protein
VVDVYGVISAGQLDLSRTGQVRTSGHPSLPYLVVDGAGHEIEPISMFLRDLMLGDVSPLTCRSYGCPKSIGLALAHE